MANNPLQKYFRQPKIYVNLPSKGIYSKPGSIENGTDNLPIYPMTGMDEILLKTPDALLSGEATVKVLESCCPAIKDGWEVSNLDIDLLLTAIRIATFGNSMSVTHTCKNCESSSDYDLDLGKFIEHFDSCVYDNTIKIDQLTIKLQPLTYKQIADYNLKSFALQRQLAQGLATNTDEEQQKLVSQLFQQLADLQSGVFLQGIESVDVPEGVVNKQEYIKEWLANTEKSVFDAIREQIEKNRKIWKLPTNKVVCPDCGTEGEFEVELDQSNFFVNA